MLASSFDFRSHFSVYKSDLGNQWAIVTSAGSLKIDSDRWQPLETIIIVTLGTNLQGARHCTNGLRDCTYSEDFTG